MHLLPLATSIVQKLVEAGHIAYFAGGWVRDKLLGKVSADIDIATSASPQEIMALFAKTIPLGIAFGSVVVVLEGHNFEVTTFRKEGPYLDARRPSHVELSDAEEDAKRRSFTINGMFYDPLTDQVIDFVGGREDLKRGMIRTIGNPDERFAEDRLRMIRAVRFATRLGFTIEEATGQAIHRHAKTLFPAVTMERVWQEFNKLGDVSKLGQFFRQLHHFGLLETIFPTLKRLSAQELLERTHHLESLPQETPTIIYVMELFPQASAQERLSLCQYLKTSQAESKLALLMGEAETLLANPKADLLEWVHFYASKNSQLCLEVIAARQKDPHLIAHHQERQRQLSAHIQRIKSGRPLVTAHHLKEKGIAPGKLMGQLLKEAQRIAVDGNLSDADEIIRRLKLTPLWPKS